MTAIASLLSTTAAVTPSGLTPVTAATSIPFPTLVLPSFPPATADGRQAIAGTGNALPAPQGEADALAWLGVGVADLGEGPVTAGSTGLHQLAGASPEAATAAALAPGVRSTAAMIASPGRRDAAFIGIPASLRSDEEGEVLTGASTRHVSEDDGNAAEVTASTGADPAPAVPTPFAATQPFATPNAAAAAATEEAFVPASPSSLRSEGAAPVRASEAVTYHILPGTDSADVQAPATIAARAISALELSPPPTTPLSTATLTNVMDTLVSPPGDARVGHRTGAPLADRALLSTMRQSMPAQINAPQPSEAPVVSRPAAFTDARAPVPQPAIAPAIPGATVPGAASARVPPPVPVARAPGTLAATLVVPGESQFARPTSQAVTFSGDRPASLDGMAVNLRVRMAAPLATTPRAPVDLPAAAPPTSTSAPAAQVFAAAIHRALGDQDGRPSADLGVALPTLSAVVTTASTSIAAQGGALDMRHAAWPAAMIERIATMRDMAAEHDTRLRLSPDMLGTIDVSLKRDGDAVQVQISAEQAQTRQLLAEAQPRLTELADARGVKLHLTGGQSGATGQQPGNGMGGGGGTGGDAPRQQSAPAPSLFTRPRSVAERDDAANDERIA